MIVFVRGNLSDSDGIESEISNDREDGKVVINFGIESVSRDIEVVGEYLYEEYRDECSRHLSGDLRESIGIDFFGGQEKNKEEII